MAGIERAHRSRAKVSRDGRDAANAVLRVTGILLLAGLLAGCAAEARRDLHAGDRPLRLAEGVSVALRGSQVRYVGEITTEGVAATRRLAQGRRVDELRITSAGGEINAGMDLGEWVHEHGLTVLVDEYCLSSCANYVFPAAWQKVLAAGAVVAWHGSARQRDLPAQLARVVDDQVKVLVLSEPARAGERARREREASAYLSRAIARQDAFFARIGVSEFITRIGQERYDVSGLYTLRVADMRRFGIDNVLAPAGDVADDVSAVERKLEVRIVRLQLESGSSVSAR